MKSAIRENFPGLEIVQVRDGQCCIGRFGVDFLLAVYKDSSAEALDPLWKLMRESRSKSLVVMLHLKEGIPPPQGDARTALTDTFKVTKDHMALFHVVGHGGGFWVAANRAAAATYRLISGGYPIHFSDDLPSSVRLVAETTRVGAGTIEEALTFLWDQVGGQDG
ncbi:MAG: hypothetical protein AAGE52_33380 [Myxococcota bacterium]